MDPAHEAAILAKLVLLEDRVSRLEESDQERTSVGKEIYGLV